MRWYAKPRETKRRSEAGSMMGSSGDEQNRTPHYLEIPSIYAAVENVERERTGLK